MTTNYHTAIAANASAVNTTFNTPLAALDAKINPTYTSYSADGDTSTTVTTAGTYYAVSAFEVSFTPSYAGQVFTCHLVLNSWTTATAGDITAALLITDSVDASVVTLGYAKEYADASAHTVHLAFSLPWSADTSGVVRKAKVYVTHSVNGAVVHAALKRLYVVYH